MSHWIALRLAESAAANCHCYTGGLRGEKSVPRRTPAAATDCAGAGGCLVVAALPLRGARGHLRWRLRGSRVQGSNHRGRQERLGGGGACDCQTVSKAARAAAAGWEREAAAAAAKRNAAGGMLRGRWGAAAGVAVAVLSAGMLGAPTVAQVVCDLECQETVSYKGAWLPVHCCRPRDCVCVCDCALATLTVPACPPAQAPASRWTSGGCAT